jgi:hypothetical protein
METIGIIANRQQAVTRIVSPKLNRLEQSDSAVVLVRANLRWNHTSLYVKKGEEYQFLPLPGQCWVDLIFPATPKGYSFALTEWYMSLAKNLKHLPGEKWMALGGAIGEADKTAFLVGDSVRHTMETEGEVTCFANDAKGFFWNNFGHMWVSICRVS